MNMDVKPSDFGSDFGIDHFLVPVLADFFASLNNPCNPA